MIKIQFWSKKSKTDNTFQIFPEKIEELETHYFEDKKMLAVMKNSLPSTGEKVSRNFKTNYLRKATSVVNGSLKEEYPFGTIFRISGAILDPEKYEIKVDLPLFLCVQDSYMFCWKLGFDCGENESLVEFVFTGEHERFFF